MTERTSFWRLASLLVAVVVTVGAWAPADARIHSLTGNARAQIGDGLPIPIGFTPPPNGKIAAIPGATIRQHGVHTVNNPAGVVLRPGQLTWPGPNQVIPVFGNNPQVFQVKTAIPLVVPGQTAALHAGGRTGAATVTACPGDVVTPVGNPACASGSAGTIPGRLTYTATSNQFGGPARATVGGVADVALKAGVGAPCAGGTNPNCLIIFAIANPAPTAANGAPFASNQTTGAAPSPGLFRGNVTAGGLVTALLTPLGAGLPNPATSFGGPHTTGVLKVEQPAALGGAETFTFSGNDGRAGPDGIGSLSLVSGSVSQRGVSGPNANRSWTNLTVGAVISSVPVMPAIGAVVLAGLTALSGAWVMRRKR